MAKFKMDDLFSGPSKQAVGQSGAEAVNIGLIDANEANDIYSLGDVGLLKASIRAEGLHAPVTVTPGETGRYRMVAGHRRLQAYKELRAELGEEYAAIPARVKTYASALQEQLDLLLDNATGREMTDYERLMQYQRLKDVLGRMKQETGAAGKVRDLVRAELKISSGQAARYEMVLHHCPKWNLDSLRDGRMTITQAYERAQQEKAYKEAAAKRKAEETARAAQQPAAPAKAGPAKREKQKPPEPIDWTQAGKLALKNDARRELFVKGWEHWPLWVEVPELGMTVRRYMLPDGSCLTASTYQESKTAWGYVRGVYPRFGVIVAGEAYYPDNEGMTALLEQLKKFKEV